MPITLGILAQSRQAVSAGAYDLLETTVLGSAAASVTFSSLGTYATDYQHLQIRAVMRGAGSFGSLRTEVVLNGSATGYASHELIGDGSSVSSGAYTSGTFARTGRIIGNTSTANSFTTQVIDILDAFETSKNTTIRTLGGSTGYNQIYLTSAFWNNTASITSINLKPEVGDWAQYSRFSLYGIKGA